jgi:uncharacterized membrane protein YkoI
MALRSPFVAALTMLALVSMSAAPLADAKERNRRGEQSEAREQFMAGQVKSLREIEGRIVPRMRGMQYLGPEYDSDSQVYRLKFLDNGHVIFVDVDARTGAILRQSG